ncbi:UvrD-helicase domain-containing protein [Tenacibaculum aestuarii]|uniref:UvrD-helicase domain-containing protein n=1 Tax=Tenacibaculum aestuarii TaxID=362781 RepID=UPI003894B905
MSNHKLIISSAGSGKTTYLVNTALEASSKKVLITTYTENNQKEIKNKFIDVRGFVPNNVTIQTWFSFLIQHGVKPFQGSLWEPLYDHDIKGMILVNKKSGMKYYDKKLKRPVYFGEDNPNKFYFGKGYIYSDKLAKMVVNTNSSSEGKVVSRISRIYDHIMIDEVQDLAGYDLDLIKLLMKDCSNITMVGDPRQVTYLTHLEARHKKYREGNIEQFLLEKCKRSIGDNGIDKTTLVNSHRCCAEVCNYASKLYSDLPATVTCDCCNTNSDTHQGVFLVKPEDVKQYLNAYEPVQLKWNKKVHINPFYDSQNFGESKGASHDRVLIYPTEKMTEWIENSIDLPNETRAKFYVAITRARFSVGIIHDYDKDKLYDGLIKYQPEK